MVKWVNPAGDSTPARPETVARLGFELQAVVLDAVCGYGKLGVLRIQRRQQLATEWAKSTTAAAFAAAGVRRGGEKGLRCTRGGAGGGYELLVLR